MLQQRKHSSGGIAAWQQNQPKYIKSSQLQLEREVGWDELLRDIMPLVHSFLFFLCVLFWCSHLKVFKLRCTIWKKAQVVV